MKRPEEVGKWWASYTIESGEWEIAKRPPPYEVKLGPFDSFWMAKSQIMGKLYKLRQRRWMLEVRKSKEDGVAILNEGLGER